MTRLVPRCLTVVLLHSLLCVLAVGDDADACRLHGPLLVRSRPVIERLPLKVVSPVDVAVSGFGDTLVADTTGKVVFRIDRDGDASLLLKGQSGLQRVAYSRVYGPHVLRASQGSGSIVRVTETGYQSVIDLPFRPAGLGIDANGGIFTARARTGDVFRVDSEGHRKLLTRVSEPIKDLTVDGQGTALTLLESGKVVAVFSDGTRHVEGYLPAATTRIRTDSAGQVAGLFHDVQAGKTLLLQPGEKLGDHHQLASVPRGTSAFAFDRLGNLTLANPQLRALTRVTSHFEVPCPQTGKMIRITLTPDAPDYAPEQERSF